MRTLSASSARSAENIWITQSSSTSDTCGAFSRPMWTTTIDPGHTSRSPRIAQRGARHRVRMLARSSPFPRLAACTIAISASPPDLRWRSSVSRRTRRNGRYTISVPKTECQTRSAPYLADRPAPGRIEPDQQIASCHCASSSRHDSRLMEFAIGTPISCVILRSQTTPQTRTASARRLTLLLILEGASHIYFYHQNGRLYHPWAEAILDRFEPHPILVGVPPSRQIRGAEPRRYASAHHRKRGYRPHDRRARSGQRKERVILVALPVVRLQTCASQRLCLLNLSGCHLRSNCVSIVRRSFPSFALQ